MAVIPSSYLIEKGKEVADDAVKKVCRFCGREFAIPKEEAVKYEKSTVCDDPACIKAADDEAAVAAANLMKSNTDSETVVKTALGN